MIDQQRTHLPAMAHLFNHDARDGPAVPIRRSVLQEIALLLHAGKLGIALVDDHVHQRIAHLLGRNLPEVLPLALSLVRPELDLVGIDRAIQRVKVEGINLVGIDANILAPVVEQTNPVTERPNLRNFSRHALLP